MRDFLLLTSTFQDILRDLGLPWPEKAVIEPPKDPRHGDLATNLALVLTKQAGMPPRALAERLSAALTDKLGKLVSTDIAGPGFLNVTFAPAFWRQVVTIAEEEGERFGSSDTGHGRKIQLEYVSANPTGPLLHQRVGAYPNVVAEGGANFWDAFRVIPVGEAFWHDGVRLEVFPVRHHWPETAYGLRLRGSVVWTGDTRPIPEMLRRHADADELIAHDCALHGNPSHSGIDDLEREYDPAVLSRCVLYHYASAADGEALAARGHRVARQGEVFALAEPSAERVTAA